MVAALSETEVPSYDAIVMRGYKTYYPTPVHTSGEEKFRLLLLVTEEAVSKYNPTPLLCSSMAIWIRMEFPCGPVLVGAAYRQWTGAEEEVNLQDFHNNLRELMAKYERAVICGDMNLDWSRREDRLYYRRKLLLAHRDCLNECGLTVANDPAPTFYSHGTFETKSGDTERKTSILDHVCYSGLPPPNFEVLPYSATDHRPTLAKFNLHRYKTDIRVTHRRNFKSANSSRLCGIINAEKLSRVFHLDDAEAIHKIIVQEIVEALDIVAPLQQIVTKERKVPLYLSTLTLKTMKERDAAAASSNHVLYRRLRNRVASLVRRDKLASNRNFLEQRSYDPKSIWQLANVAAGRSAGAALPQELRAGVETVKGDRNMANHVNLFYVDKIRRIRARIEEERELPQQEQQQQQQQPQEQEAEPDHNFELRPPSKATVLRIILSLNNTKALGIDGIPVMVLKGLAPLLAAPMAHLIRKSFESGVVPKAFKHALVTPIHKKGKPLQEASSYRPVSILVAMSKIMEKAALLQLSPHLAPLLPPTQFGFRPGRSTSAAIAYAQGTWQAARAKGEQVAITGWDLSAAFDTIDVDMLTTKLRDFGVGSKANRSLRSYLSDRCQQVRYNAALSHPLPVCHGVPQGSILGPLLFLVLVADLPSTVMEAAGRNNGDNSSSGSGSSSCSSSSSSASASASSSLSVGVSAYADDLVCWITSKNPGAIVNGLEAVSAAIVTYMNRNYLALNESKTQLVWLGAQKQPIKVGKCLVQPSEELEMLGVSFDKVLTPVPHVKSLISSARTLSAMARRLSLHLPPSSLHTVMGALVRGKLGYACLILPPRLKESDPTNQLMAKLQVCINDIGRAIIGCKRSEKKRVEDILIESELPSINRLIIRTVCVEAWKALNFRDAPDVGLTPLGNLLLSNCAPPPLQHPRRQLWLPPSSLLTPNGELPLVGVHLLEQVPPPAHCPHVGRRKEGRKRAGHVCPHLA